VRPSFPELPYSIVFLSVDIRGEHINQSPWESPWEGWPTCSVGSAEKSCVACQRHALCCTGWPTLRAFLLLTFRISLSCDVRMVLENSSRLGKSLDIKPFFFLSAGTVSLYMVLSMYLSFDSDHSILGGSSVLHNSKGVTRCFGPARSHCRAPQARTLGRRETSGESGCRRRTASRSPMLACRTCSYLCKGRPAQQRAQ
jgi:hypothetical protein